MTTLLINVTAEDVARGRQSDCQSCPVALALYRAAVGQWGRNFFTMVEAGYEALQVLDTDEGEFSAPTPAAAFEFMGVFDNGEPVAPFAFEAEFEPMPPRTDDEEDEG